MSELKFGVDAPWDEDCLVCGPGLEIDPECPGHCTDVAGEHQAALVELIEQEVILREPTERWPRLEAYVEPFDLAGRESQVRSWKVAFEEAVGEVWRDEFEHKRRSTNLAVEVMLTLADMSDKETLTLRDLLMDKRVLSRTEDLEVEFERFISDMVTSDAAEFEKQTGESLEGML